MISWKEDLRSKETYAWKHSKGGSYAWSPAAVAYLVSLTDEDYDRARAEYRAAQQTKK